MKKQGRPIGTTKLTDEDRELAFQLYRTGLPILEIAEKFEVGRSTMYRELRPLLKEHKNQLCPRCLRRLHI